MRRMDHVPLPEGFDFLRVPSLLTESREKLARIRPRTLGQASRIPGVTPADVQILWVYLEKRRREAGGRVGLCSGAEGPVGTTRT